MSNQDKNKIILDFKDISTSSLIYDLPTVINYNNNLSKRCLNHIYDFSKDYITKPVKTTGIVSGNTGEFNSLVINDKLNISPKAAQTVFIDNHVVVDHSLTINKDNNAHTIDAIYDASSNISLSAILASLKTRISTIENITGTNDSAIMNAVNDISTRLNQLFEIINQISYEDKKTDLLNEE